MYCFSASRVFHTIQSSGILFCMAILCASCCCAPEEGTPLSFDFLAESQGFRGDFVDYPAGRESEFEFMATHKALPAPLGPDNGWLLSVNNLSDDVFVFLQKKIEGLEPNRKYRVTSVVHFVSNYGQGCDVGVASSTLIKAGASGTEPMKVVDNQGNVRLNIDHGQQSNNGTAAVILGDLRNGQAGCSDATPYAKRILTSPASIEATSTANGALWLILGADSGFESIFHFYFTRFEVTLEAV